MTATTAPVETILARLEGVRPAGSGWVARCPAHDDHNPSLSVREGDDGRALVHCYAGCEPDAIVQALGLTISDLFVREPTAATRAFTFDRPAQRQRGRIVATYDYRDEAGRLLYQAVRYEPKAFAQRRPDPAAPSGWAWNLEGVRRVLYRLPELLASDPRVAAAPIVVCEGEKDADRLAGLGVVATTCAQGANGWKSDYNYPTSLAGRHVAIIPDNDVPGRQHAERVARSLAGVAASVRVVELPGVPAKGDASDWLDAGGTRQALEALIAAAPEWTPAAEPVEPIGGPAVGPVLDIVSMADVEARDVSWLWHRWLLASHLTLLGGHPGDGKSTLAAALAATLSTGGTWPDGTPAPTGNALFLLAEDGIEDTLKPRLDLHKADHSRIYAVRAVRDPSGHDRVFNLREHIDMLDAAIVSHDIALVVIDPLSAFLTGADRNGEDVRDILTPLVQLLDRRQVACLGIMHVGKPGAGTGARRGLQMFLGATAFGAIARSAWALAAAPTDNDQFRRVLGVVKTNLGMRPTNLAFTRSEDGPTRWLGETADNIEELLNGNAWKDAKSPERQYILDVLDGKPDGMAPQDIADRLGKTPSSIRQLLRKMEEAGEVRRPKTGIYAAPSHRFIDSVDSRPQESTESMESTNLWQGHPVDSSADTLSCRDCGAPLYTPESIDAGQCQRCRAAGAS